jgi:NAD(P)-dependent dehydrogenase (short-subunit alcohol dehydrogenase family)
MTAPGPDHAPAGRPAAPVALVTGGQQGIGLGIATALGQAGFRLAIAALPGRDDPAVEAALALLPPGTLYVSHDISDIARTPALLDAVEETLGPVDTLVSNAGIPARIRGDLLDLAPESFDAVLSVNTRGTFFLAQACARRMLAHPGPHYRSLVFVTSVSATMASPERGEYCISKAASAMTAQLMALRLAPHGIGVFDLRPGIIATPMTAPVTARYDDRIRDGLVPAGRWGLPEDIGRTVVSLATGQFAFATGAVIPVDGGLSIPRL